MTKSSFGLLLSLLVIVSAQPAQACKQLIYCAATRSADIVFVGKLEKVFNSPQSGHIKPAYLTFTVSQVLKGSVPHIIIVRDRGDRCHDISFINMGPSSSNEYLMFAMEKNGRYETHHNFPNGLTDKWEAPRYLEEMKDANTLENEIIGKTPCPRNAAH